MRRYYICVKFDPHIVKSTFVRRTPKVSFVGVVLRAESLFSRTSAVKFQVCGKSAFGMQNETDKANFKCTADKNSFKNVEVKFYTNIISSHM